MTMAGTPLCRAGLLARARRNSPVARSGQHRLQLLLLHHRLDEIAHPAAHSKFDRVKPVVEKLGLSPLHVPRNQDARYASSWRSLQPSALTPGDSRLNTPETQFPETDVDKADLENLIGDLMSGQYSDSVRVVGCRCD
jgi:hypothetical protein